MYCFVGILSTFVKRSAEKDVKMIMCSSTSSMFVRRYSSKLFNAKYSLEEQRKILDTVNNGSNEELYRFDISKARIKKLEIWKRKQGNFSSLEELLEVDSLGEKVLDKFYKSIIETEGHGVERKTVKKSPGKIRGNILVPLLDDLKINKISSAVGIHISGTSISWTKIIRNDNLITSWNKYEFPEVQKKLHITEFLNMVMEASNTIPPADVYVLEAMPSLAPSTQNTSVSLTTYLRNLQIITCLVALLNMSPKHNLALPKNYSTANNMIQFNNVYFLRSKLYSRLFKTLVGTEKISSAATVLEILDSPQPKKYYSKLNFEQQCRSYYDALDPVNKEILGQTLLLTVAFMELCIYKNPNSLQAISPGFRDQ